MKLLAQPTNPMPIAGDIFSITATELISKSHRSIVEWEDFSISLQESFQFKLPDSSAAILNRVIGRLPSSIMGKLVSNGQIILINPNGVVIGNQGIIEVGSFIASTLDVTNSAFLKGGELLFVGDSDKGIEQQGLIKAQDGDVFLIGHSIRNSGEIVAPSGSVNFAAGKRILVQPKESDFVVIDAGESAAIDHSGNVDAAAIKLQAGSNPYSLAINQSGLVEALEVEQCEGGVHLVVSKGMTSVSGHLIANEGKVDVLGDEVLIDQSAHIAAREGEVHIGGGYQGDDIALKNSQQTLVRKGAFLDVSSLSQNSAGTIIVWSDGVTKFEAEAHARGGNQGGDGGFVEISGSKDLFYRGFVDTRAPLGNTGQLLLGPSTITISLAATAGGSFVGGVFDPGGIAANINIGDLNTTLSGTNVLITTLSGVGGTGDIIFSSAGGTTAISSPGNNLTLNADRDIRFSRDTTFTDTVGNTAEFTFNATRNIFSDAGDFVNCTSAKSFAFNADNNITVNENMTFTDVETVSFSAGGTIDINDPILVSGSNSFTMTATVDVDIDDLITLTGGNNSFILEATTGEIRYSADVRSDAPVTTFRAPAATGDITFDGGGDFFYTNTTTPGVVSFIAGQDINVNTDMDFDDLSGSQNATFNLTAGNDFISGTTNDIDVRDANSVSITAGNDVTFRDPVRVTGTNTFSVEATGGEITVDGSITSNATTTTFSAPTPGTGDITFTTGGGSILAGPASPATFTFTAGNDINISDDLTFSDTSGVKNVSFSLIAGNDIIGNPTFFTTFNNANSVTWTAANDITINDPFNANGVTTVNLTATSGNLNVFDTIDTNATTTDLNAGTNIVVRSQVEVNAGTGGDLNVTAGNDIIVGGPSATIVTRIGTRVGTLTINAANNLSVSGGSTPSDYAQIGFNSTVVNSDIDLTVGNDLILTGGTLTGTMALIGHGTINPIGGMYTGNIILRSIGGDVTLSGGTTTDTWAQIGHTRGVSGAVTAVGDIRGPTAGSNTGISGNLILTAGSGNTSYAFVGHGGQASAQEDIYSGEIHLQANEITLTAGSNTDAFAAIGFYAVNTGTGTVSVSSGSEAHAISDTFLTMQGGTGTRANTSIGARMPRTSTGLAAMTLSAVEAQTASGNDLSLLAGSNEAVIGAFVDAGAASVAVTTVTSGQDILLTAESGEARIVNGFAATPNAAVNMTANRDIVLTAGTGVAAIDSVDTITMETLTADILLFDSPTAASHITAQNASSTTTITAATDLILTAANGTGAFIEAEEDNLIVQATNGSITVNTDTYIENKGLTASSTLRTFSGNDTFVQNGGYIRNNGLGMTEAESGNSIFVVNGASIEGMGLVTVNTGNDLLLLGGVTGPAFIRGADETNVTSGNNITLLGASPTNDAYIETSLGNLTVTAAKDISISSNGRIENLSPGSALTLIVDNQAPSAPAIGNGMFSLSVNGSVATTVGGPLRIFTARRSQNTILGTGNMNGTTYVPGPLFIDSATEIWNTYFPSLQGGMPFTIFYKDSSTTPIFPVITAIPMLGPNDLIGDYELYYMLDRIPWFTDWMWDFYIESEDEVTNREWYFVPHQKYLPFPRVPI
ncbi:beta strand repeat-containing protein [Simkania sp.]|uniref:beta strand repeat-containing protein n=1 Tax=Simkania sp. TaxID=34094 RepID=UPI003B52026A